MQWHAFCGIASAVHPGAVRGGLLKHQKAKIAWWVGEYLADCLEHIVLSFYWSEREAALTTLYAATSSALKERDQRGEYFIPIARPFQPSIHANDEVLIPFWLIARHSFGGALARDTLKTGAGTRPVEVHAWPLGGQGSEAFGRPVICC